MKKEKILKLWNGRGHGYTHNRHHFNVAAYTQKQAAELVSIASGFPISVSEIRVYYSNCWGNSMKGIIPTEPIVYVNEPFGKDIIATYKLTDKKQDNDTI